MESLLPASLRVATVLSLALLVLAPGVAADENLVENTVADAVEFVEMNKSELVEGASEFVEMNKSELVEAAHDLTG